MKTNNQLGWRENLAKNNPRFREHESYEPPLEGRRYRRKFERELKKALKREIAKSLNGE